MTTTNTIKFNVGGKHFEVSRDLMEEHSETMLGKLVSEAWQQDPDEQVFIDRDGDIFAHVLNYLRYGSIELPHTVPRSSFERDLDFYGIVLKEGEIKEKSFDMIASLRQDRDEAKKHLNSAENKYEMCVFAAAVYHEYIMEKERNKELVRISGSSIRASLNDHFEKGKDRSGNLSQTEKDDFVYFLDVYFGLRMATPSECRKEGYSNSFCTPYLRAGASFCVTRK